MKRKILFALLLAIIGLTSFSQKGQRIAFVDMNYILENIPDYKKAQDQLDKKVQKWQQNLDNIKGEIETMKTELSNEKVLLTEDLIIEKEEDIAIKEAEFKKVEAQYFSSNGNLFLLRKQLVTPIQDQVYNAAQEIAKARRYDFVFDKSSDLIMLYSNKANDISDLVLRIIVRGEKATKANKKRADRNAITPQRNTPRGAVTSASNVKTTPVKNNDSAVPVISSNTENTKTSADISDQPSTIEKSATVSKTATNDFSNIEETTTESFVDPNQIKIDEREAKRQVALDKIEKQKVDRALKREAQKAAIEQKRLERLKQREEVRNQLKNNKEKNADDKKENSKDEKEDEKIDNNK